ncbi:MAG: HAMP domain-containing histidine kinase [Deltaproteobacteria bacterium]|nr:HAMP domain-containing histidine kinase [Deltaproteobacteria bacterium]MBP7289374.1 HAMP domain-containing histidine kinase [Nannocystaceae bacterium]
MRSAEPTLARRLMWTLALSASAAAAIALIAVSLLADGLIRHRVEQGVVAAAAVLVAELDEEPQLAAEIEEEARELGIDGRVALARQGQLEYGDASVVAPPQRPCGAAEQMLICVQASTHDPMLEVRVAVPASRAFGHRRPLALAAAAVLVVVVSGAIAFGVLQARRAIAPLTRLRVAVEQIAVARPERLQLPARVGLQEVDALRDTLADLLARLSFELTRARQFSADAAHELRTPLTKLKAELELAAETVPVDAAIAEVIARLRRTTEQLSLLTERLLLLATPGEALSSNAGTSIAALVLALGDAGGDVRRPAAERERLVPRVDEVDALVRGDAVLLAAMLDNAVDNALKFSSSSVEVGVTAVSDHVILTIDDRGPGVPDRERVVLFEPFRRGADARAKPGHGLGLALVAHIARAHGGDAAFCDRDGGGTRLRITLPRHRGASAMDA